MRDISNRRREKNEGMGLVNGKRIKDEELEKKYTVEKKRKKKAEGNE